MAKFTCDLRLPEGDDIRDSRIYSIEAGTRDEAVQIARTLLNHVEIVCHEVEAPSSSDRRIDFTEYYRKRFADAEK